MDFSLYSFIMALMWGTAFVIICALFLRNNNFIRHFGLGTLIFLFIGCFIRLAIPVEFPWMRILSLDQVYTHINDALYLEIQLPLVGQCTLLWILIVLWAIGSIIALCILLWKYNSFLRKLKVYGTNSRVEAEELLQSLALDMHMKHAPRLIFVPGLYSPLLTGYGHPEIYMPDLDFTQEELTHILRHELIHHKTHDLWIKLLIHIFCCLLWWNPFVYLLKINLDQILELRCDYNVTRQYSTASVHDYLEAILKVAKANSNTVTRASGSSLTNHLFSACYPANTKQRFALLLTPAPRKRPVGIQYLCYGLCILALVLSYSFILQPEYAPPAEEMSGTSIVEFTRDSSYVIAYKDGTYAIVIDGLSPDMISNQDANIYIDLGFELKPVDGVYPRIPD